MNTCYTLNKTDAFSVVGKVPPRLPLLTRESILTTVEVFAIHFEKLSLSAKEIYSGFALELAQLACHITSEIKCVT